MQNPLILYYPHAYPPLILSHPIHALPIFCPTPCMPSPYSVPPHAYPPPILSHPMHALPLFYPTPCMPSRGGYWYRKSYCNILRHVTPYYDLYHDVLGLLVCFVCEFFSANLWDILQIVGMCTLIFYFLRGNFHLNDGKILGNLQDVFY